MRTHECIHRHRIKPPTHTKAFERFVNKSFDISTRPEQCCGEKGQMDEVTDTIKNAVTKLRPLQQSKKMRR